MLLHLPPAVLGWRQTGCSRRGHSGPSKRVHRVLSLPYQLCWDNQLGSLLLPASQPVHESLYSRAYL